MSFGPSGLRLSAATSLTHTLGEGGAWNASAFRSLGTYFFFLFDFTCNSYVYYVYPTADAAWGPKRLSTSFGPSRLPRHTHHRRREGLETRPHLEPLVHLFFVFFFLTILMLIYSQITVLSRRITEYPTAKTTTRMGPIDPLSHHITPTMILVYPHWCFLTVLFYVFGCGESWGRTVG